MHLVCQSSMCAETRMFCFFYYSPIACLSFAHSFLLMYFVSDSFRQRKELPRKKRTYSIVSKYNTFIWWLLNKEERFWQESYSKHDLTSAPCRSTCCKKGPSKFGDVISWLVRSLSSAKRIQQLPETRGW